MTMQTTILALATIIISACAFVIMSQNIERADKENRGMLMQETGGQDNG